MCDNNRSKIFCIGLVYNATGYIPDKKTVPKNIAGVHSTSSQEKNERPFAPLNLPLGALMDRYTDQIVWLANQFKFKEEEKALLIPFETLFFRREHLSWFCKWMDNKNVSLSINHPFFVSLEKNVSALQDTPTDFLAFIKEVFSESEPSIEKRKRFDTELDRLYKSRVDILERAFPVRSPQPQEKSLSNNRP